jgi:DNA polymerase I
VSRALLHSLLVDCQPNAVRAICQGYNALARLPFCRLWVIDAEFMTNGNPHRTWCMSGFELRTGAQFELWTDGYRGPPPFFADYHTLVISFVAGAETCCWRQLGWPMPMHILDLFQEARTVANTGSKADPQSLVDHCRLAGIGVMDLELKHEMQLEAQRRTVWSDDARAKMMAYNVCDVFKEAQLFLALLPRLLALWGNDPERGLYFALMRGECAAALGKAELRGIPVDPDEWSVLEIGKPNIYPAMVAALPLDLRAIYRDTRKGPTFTEKAFDKLMAAQPGLTDDWPRTPKSNQLVTTTEVLHQMLDPIDRLRPLVEVMTARSTVALLQWQVGDDCHCRTLISPGRTTTGRCAPKGREFPFAAPKRFRHALQAPLGWVILQADYAGQEAGILAEQAQDPAYIAAYRSDDIHLTCAKMCDIVPESATADTHPEERAQLKTVNHSLSYGARARRVAAQLGKELHVAEHLIRTHQRVFRRTHDYLAACEDTADLDRQVTTQDGWHRRFVTPFSTTSARNFGVQATGAAILRRSIVLADRAGLPLVATVHDSLVFCCPLADAPEVLLEAERVMVEAGHYFCPGITLRVDFAASRPVIVPGRVVKPLADPKSREGYDRVLDQARQGAAEVA